jgi:benzoyl-CoA reductase subunit B
MATEKKKAINRLQSIYPLRALVDERYKRSLEAIKAGKPTAWSMVNWWLPEAILNVMGIETMYPENYGPVCAATGTAEAYLNRADAEGFPSHLCGYARNTLGYTARMMKDLEGQIPPEAPMGGMPKPSLLLSSGIACDARYKWFQALGRYMDVPVWVLELPHPGVEEEATEGVHEHNISFMVEGLREFVAFVERLLGKKMDWDKLYEAQRDIEEICRIWHETNELRKAKPCPMHARDFWTGMTGALFPSGNLKELLELYRKTYDEVKHRVDNNICSILEEKYRIVFAELPPWHSLGFFDKLAERGWNFVMESWNYHPPIPLDMSGISDPLERIARFNYQWLNGRFQRALGEGEYLAFAYPYLEFAREYKIDGAFLHTLLTCRSATSHLNYMQDMLMRKVKVPSLVVEGDIVDLRLFNPEDVLSKSQAFEETMEHYKEARKKEGADW